MGKSGFVRRGAAVAFWWFMIVSQHPGGVLTAATQAPSEPRRSVNGAGSRSR